MSGTEMLSTLSTTEDEYIFGEIEFEDDGFNASTFVSKYRKVSSLESLKEQLISYSNKLKQQLYLIINRDYKDFITISTKVSSQYIIYLCYTSRVLTNKSFYYLCWSEHQLDGVDSRIDQLKKPLVDLRLDLSTLHDGMVCIKFYNYARMHAFNPLWTCV